ncbi:Aste57867_12568 [Aphanomyces stellatus]|uniref:Aste57867_12568 protein n=1 Tax=Aphanomyces stellatus TaxID=120398 RepID=A0A485KVY3_9STRA|nr:hypothetical protein As57867_012522 [Aphanomyces stellatus]VFT89419.1 Aste57867_12568 [Aphanomyces stellatus]
MSGGMTWRCGDLGGGRIVLVSYYTKYPLAVAQSGSYPNQVIVNSTMKQTDPWAIWTVTDLTRPYVSVFPPPATPSPPVPTTASLVSPCNVVDGDVVTLQSDTGNFIARCHGCIPNAMYPDAAFVPNTTNASSANWKVFNTGTGKLAFQADSGKFLARCNGCAPTTPDQAFVHVSDWQGQPWAQWTCVDLGKGKVALQADSGNFLARCNGCERGTAYADSATVYMNTWQNAPWAQWSLVDQTPRTGAFLGADSARHRCGQ